MALKKRALQGWVWESLTDCQPMALFQGEATLGVKGRCQMQSNYQGFKALSQSFLLVAKAALIMAAENAKT